MRTRREIINLFAGALVCSAAPVYVNATGYIRSAGDIRKLKMNNSRTGEYIDLVYWVEGEYIYEAVKEFSYFMRDWRQNKAIQYDPRNLDLLAASQLLMDSSEPFELLSGYRTKKTNRMLSNIYDGVAQNSYHMKAMAADVRMRSRSVSQISKSARSCRGGGVGRYYRSNFTHIDCGPVRYWQK